MHIGAPALLALLTRGVTARTADPGSAAQFDV